MAVAVAVGRSSNIGQDDILATIRSENLQVYRIAPTRLRSDVGQESEVANNYQGRLVYELLQNADDAMVDDDGSLAGISFQLTDDALWVANSGRPLTDGDLRGLCELSASVKSLATGPRRATIGHKGMGFKSVLEITDAPEVYSTTYAFRFSGAGARAALQPLVDENKIPVGAHVPICRFPWPITASPLEWSEFVARGMRTAFRFPLRHDLSQEQRNRLADSLIELSFTALLFLKHLRGIDVVVDRQNDHRAFAWTIIREQATSDGVAEVSLRPERGQGHTFLVAQERDVPIGAHRAGLSQNLWEEIEVTEVSVAARLVDDHPVALDPDWQRLHVFLPSAVRCPYHVLINGAFNADISRQGIPVRADSNDYNRFLLSVAAALIRDRLFPALRRRGAPFVELTRLLDRGPDVGTLMPSPAEKAIIEEMRVAFRHAPFVPAESGESLSPTACVVPPLVSDPRVGKIFRIVLNRAATFGQRAFPNPDGCGADIARVLIDFGAQSLTLIDAAAVLASQIGERDIAWMDWERRGAWIDPILTVLEELWRSLPVGQQETFAHAVRRRALFPVRVDPLGPGSDADRGRVRREVLGDAQAFYPPGSLDGASVPFAELRFLASGICWGALNRQERQERLKRQMDAWAGLFDVKEFRFAEILRASVLTTLDLDRGPSALAERATYHSLTHLAAICQLAGRTVKSHRPLPYERLGTDRGFFNLSRLDVPCRHLGETTTSWQPAYRVYFGADWIGERSVEHVFRSSHVAAQCLATAWFLLPPDQFFGKLKPFEYLAQKSQGTLDDEVDPNEDDESALATDELTRWREFFTWLGVNSALRVIHLHDVEERSAGWLATAHLQRPSGPAFSRVGKSIWERFVQDVRDALGDALRDVVPYFYQLQNLEFLGELLAAAERDPTANVGRALYVHLVRNWSWLEHFASLEVALVPDDQRPAQRQKPPRPRESELQTVGANFWVRQLQVTHFCPTSHGPRRAAETWLPTAEVIRRFRYPVRDRSRLNFVLPVLDELQGLDPAKARGFAREIGIREELTPSDFGVADVRLVLNYLRDRFADFCIRGDILPSDLHDLIRPTYRNLIELLSSRERPERPSEGAATSPPLGHEPILVRDGAGAYRFVPAQTAFYADRRDTRDRLQADPNLATFIIEAWPAARATMPAVFGLRILEEALSWTPHPHAPALVGDDLESFRAGIAELLPEILARVSVDRQEEDRLQRDARQLAEFAAIVEPVCDLELECRLDGHQIGVASERRLAFVAQRGMSVTTAYVIWEAAAWPPGSNAEALATALSEVLGGSYFESFVALAQVGTKDARRRLLGRVGVSDADLETMRRLLTGTEPQHQGPETEASSTTEPSHAGGDSPPNAAPSEDESAPETATGAAQSDTPLRAPLYTPGELSLDGTPVSELGRSTPKTGTAPAPQAAHGRHANANASYPDRTPTDELGIWVTLAYEQHRLRRSGLAHATIFDTTIAGDQQDALVFDVSRPDKIAQARIRSPRFDRLLRQLSDTYHISVEWPGFDVLSIDPRHLDLPDRLIELKSSGTDNRIQEISWNEWKTARSAVRGRYYLYLVGNLRSDLRGRRPFVRTIADPFGQLEATIKQRRVLERKVFLAADSFLVAERLELTVRAENGT